MSTQHLFVPGPLYPDLFDGETPILLPVDKPPKVYRVAVTYSVIERNTRLITVAANSEKEAVRQAIAEAEKAGDDEEFDHDAEYVDKLDTEPTATQLQTWLARQEGNA